MESSRRRSKERHWVSDKKPNEIRNRKSETTQTKKEIKMAKIRKRMKIMKDSRRGYGDPGDIDAICLLIKNG